MDNVTIQPPINPDLTLAKLRLKLSNIAVDLGIDEYQDDCVDVIFDYTIIFMKSVIRSMARHKRKYKMICPILTGEIEKDEDNSTKNESPEEKLYPWQVKINKDIVREKNIKFLDADDLKDEEEKDGLSQESFDRQAQFPELLKSKGSMDLDAASHLERHYDASLKTVDENSSYSEKRTKNISNKRSSEEYPQKTVKKITYECITTEIVYSPKKYDVSDLMELLKMDVHIIPLRSAYEIFKRNCQEKLAPKFYRS